MGKEQMTKNCSPIGIYFLILFETCLYSVNLDEFGVYLSGNMQHIVRQMSIPLTSSLNNISEQGTTSKNETKRLFDLKVATCFVASEHINLLPIGKQNLL